jgi:hypothetical protein
MKNEGRSRKGGRDRIKLGVQVAGQKDRRQESPGQECISWNSNKEKIVGRGYRKEE